MDWSSMDLGRNSIGDSCSRLPVFSMLRNASPSPPNLPAPSCAREGDDAVQKEIQSMLAKDLIGLSSDERNQALDEIHGVLSTQEEDSELVEQSLERLEEEINLIPSENRVAYDLAKSLSYEYVHNRDFRLMFLRSDRFNAKLAASRLVNFFQHKHYLFGPRKLVQDITINDLDEDDLTTLRSGVLQILPSKDRSGRPIAIIFPGIKQFRTIENVLRAGFYLMMSRIQKDVDAQKTGWVGIHYAVGTSKRNQANIGKIAAVRNALPFKNAALHVCYDDSPRKAFLAFGVSLVASYQRVRLRVHRGTHMECIHTLLTFGIPMDALPIDVDGNVNMRQHLEWVENQMNFERTYGGSSHDNMFEAISTSSLLSDESSSGCGISRHDGGNGFGCFDNSTNNSMASSPMAAIEPSMVSSSTTPHTIRDTDVLFGRGRGMSKHPGNARFRKLVDQHVPQYERAGKYEKTSIAENIVNIIKQSDGRFLRLGKSGEWESVSDEAARNKVSHAFRARRY